MFSTYLVWVFLLPLVWYYSIILPILHQTGQSPIFSRAAQNSDLSPTDQQFGMTNHMELEFLSGGKKTIPHINLIIFLKWEHTKTVSATYIQRHNKGEAWGAYDCLALLTVLLEKGLLTVAAVQPGFFHSVAPPSSGIPPRGSLHMRRKRLWSHHNEHPVLQGNCKWYKVTTGRVPPTGTGSFVPCFLLSIGIHYKSSPFKGKPPQEKIRDMKALALSPWRVPGSAPGTGVSWYALACRMPVHWKSRLTIWSNMKQSLWATRLSSISCFQ